MGGNIDGQPVALKDGEAPTRDQRAILIAGIDSDGLGAHAQVAASGAIVTGPAHAGREVWADLFKVATATTYYLLIDLDSPTAPHAVGTMARICSGESHLIKETKNNEWEADLGVVLRTDGTSSDVAWLGFLSAHAEDSAVSIGVARYRSLAECLDLEVKDGALVKVLAGNIETGIVAINTGAGTVDDVSGDARTAAVGDVVVRAVRAVGTGSADVDFTISYFVDP